MAADLAVLSGSVTGVEVTRDRYRVLSRLRGAWVLEEGPDRGFAFPNKVDVRLILEGEEVKLPLAFSEGLNRQPTIFFLPSGEASVFSLSFRSIDIERDITSDGTGVIQLERPET